MTFAGWVALVCLFQDEGDDESFTPPKHVEKCPAECEPCQEL
jgi:hypothetical protein